MIAKTVEEGRIHDIGHAFGYYDYKEEKGMVSMFSSKEATATYICGYARGMQNGGFLHTISERGEGYIAYKLPGQKIGLKAGWPLLQGVFWSMSFKEIVQKMCTPHNTNAFAMLFAEKILTTPGMLDSLIAKFHAGRKYLVDSLDQNGYRHKGEAGNFIFIEPKTDAQTIVNRMKAEKKILIKTYPNVGEFGNCLRVSIGEEMYMKQFIHFSAENLVRRSRAGMNAA